MTKHRKWIFATLALIVLLAFCAVPATTSADVFQTQLDKAGDPYQVPPKGKAILVKIPASELIAFDQGVPVLRRRVTVGHRGIADHA